MDEWTDAEQCVERAHEHFVAGRWAEAEAELRQALSLRPDEPEWVFNLGLTLDAAGRGREAAEMFARAHELDPEDGNPSLMAGSCLLREGQLAQAIEWLERCEKAEPRMVMSYIHRIEAYARLGQHEQAELMFYMAQQIEPRRTEAMVAMADSLMDRGLHEKAEWCLKEALEIDPELEGVHARLAEVHAASGRLDRARQLYLRELRQNPGDVQTLMDLGVLLGEMNRPAEAGEKFRRVLELEPEHAEAHFELGCLAERTGDEAEALRQFDLVHRLDAEFPGVRRRLAGLLMSRRFDGRFEGRGGGADEAVELLRRELARLSSEPATFADGDLEELGGLLLDADLAVEAALPLRVLAHRRAGEARAHHLLSVALFEAGDLTGGGEAARMALSIEPRMVAAMHNLAIASLRQGRWRVAAKWLAKARKIEPDDASLRRLRWAVYLRAAWGVVRRAGTKARRGGGAV